MSRIRRMFDMVLDVIRHQTLKNIVLEIIRVSPLFLVAGIFLKRSANLPVILWALGVVALFSLASHGIRKLIFWNISMDKLYEKSLGTPLSAAIVFASIVAFLSVAFTTMVSFLR
jgi:hypothetical protein